jgi:hypothetical protein
MANKIKIVSKEELRKLHTGTLMKRREGLLKCEESFQSSDRFGYEDEPIPEETGYIEFKNTQAWRQAYREVKEILSNREHWPSRNERKESRLEKVKKKE